MFSLQGLRVHRCIADHIVSVIDPKTFRVIERIDVGQGSHGVRASRGGRCICVGLIGTDEIAVIDTQSLKAACRITTHGELPFWISVAGNNLSYCAYRAVQR